MRAPRLRLPQTIAVGLMALALTAPGAAGEQVPWGTGCMPTPAGTVRTSANCGASFSGGIATAPPGAPTAVKRAIAAANQIRGRPYAWGGGHASFSSRGYDCSGAVGYVLHAAGLLDQTMVSGQLAYWGGAGPGRWITVYANEQHVFIVIAGLRFDTRDDPPGVNGPRWKQAWADPSHFAARHPAGL